MLTLIRNDDYPALCREGADRFAAPARIRYDDRTGLRTRRIVLGDLTVLSRAGAGGFAEPAPGAYRLICSVGRTWDVRAESVLTLSDSSSTGEPAGDWVMVTLPRDLLPLPRQEVRPLLGTALSGRSGIGALVTTFVTELARSAGHYRDADAARLSAIFIDLLGSLLAHELETPGTAADEPETRSRLLRLRIQAYVQRHLADPCLSPASIAAAHHISVRSLHRLFEDHDETVAAWIRERRLERCRRDLADPRLSEDPAHKIGRKWGFTDPAHFSRVFRTAYGLSPSAYRSRESSRR